MAQPIKQIDVLVYPFYNGGHELLFKYGRKKFNLWMHNLRDALKGNGTAFCIVLNAALNERLLHTEAVHLYVEFERTVNQLIEKKSCAYRCYGRK